MNIVPSTNFTIMVSKAPFEHRNAENALAFCDAAIANGHSISQVFFYQSGVHNASVLLLPNSDEVNVYSKWCELHQKHNITLNVCVTAASRRGICDKAISMHPEGANLLPPFTQVGLSAYFESLADNSVNIQL